MPGTEQTPRWPAARRGRRGTRRARSPRFDQPFQRRPPLPHPARRSVHHLGVPHRVQPELGLQRRQVHVLVGHVDHLLAQRRPHRPGGRVLPPPGPARCATRSRARSRHQLEEQLCSCREVGIQRADGESGLLGDLLDRRTGEALRRTCARRVQQQFPGAGLGLGPGEPAPGRSGSSRSCNERYSIATTMSKSSHQHAVMRSKPCSRRTSC